MHHIHVNIAKKEIFGNINCYILITLQMFSDTLSKVIPTSKETLFHGTSLLHFEYNIVWS
jgi:hypothetical protein